VCRWVSSTRQRAVRAAGGINGDDYCSELLVGKRRRRGSAIDHKHRDVCRRYQDAECYAVIVQVTLLR
jgi:hypothetical protein